MNWLPVETTIAATEEPLTQAEALAQCRLEAGEDDTAAVAYAKAARAHVEAATGTRLVTQTVKLRADGFYHGAPFIRDYRSTGWHGQVKLPIAPVQSITTVEYLDTDNVTQTLATSVYATYLLGLSPMLVLKYGQTWPATLCSPAAVTITAVVGYGAATAVPDDIKSALKLLTSHFYDNRSESEISPGVYALLSNNRLFGF